MRTIISLTHSRPHTPTHQAIRQTIVMEKGLSTRHSPEGGTPAAGGWSDGAIKICIRSFMSARLSRSLRLTGAVNPVDPRRPRRHFPTRASRFHALSRLPLRSPRAKLPVTHHVSRITFHSLSRLPLRSLRPLRETPRHASRFTHHVSRLTFHASRFTHHVSRLTPHFSPLPSIFHALTREYFLAYSRSPSIWSSVKLDG